MPVRKSKSKEEVDGVTWTETFNCDICGKQKGSVDHWWLAWSELYSPHPEAPERHLFKIYPWENLTAHDGTVKHLMRAGLPAEAGRSLVEYRNGSSS